MKREVLDLSFSPMMFIFQNAAVKQIDVPSFSGSFGILPNHVPSLAVLKPGLITVFEADGAIKKVNLGPWRILL